MGEEIRRIRELERQVAGLKLVVALIGIASIAAATAAWKRPMQDSVLRARQLVLEDAEGRARIVLGAPLPSLVEGGVPLPPRIGMAINDSLGFERWGLSLSASGRMGMGFDAPLGTGDDRNRERINLVADQDGGAQIRFLNRRTAVAGYLRLRDDDKMWLEFLDVRADSVHRRLLGVDGEESVVTPRQ